MGAAFMEGFLGEVAPERLRLRRSLPGDTVLFLSSTSLALSHVFPSFILTCLGCFPASASTDRAARAFGDLV